MRKIVARGPDYDADSVSLETGLECKDPSLAQQHQAEEADINVIVKRFGVTGQLPVVPYPPLLDDFDQVFDFQTAQNLIVKARESFMQLPADVRFNFNNDPARFVTFVDDALESGNIEELRKMGLAVPKEARNGEANPNAGVAVGAAARGAEGDGGAAGAGA